MADGPTETALPGLVAAVLAAGGECRAAVASITGSNSVIGEGSAESAEPVQSAAAPEVSSQIGAMWIVHTQWRESANPACLAPAVSETLAPGRARSAGPVVKRLIPKGG